MPIIVILATYQAKVNELDAAWTPKHNDNNAVLFNSMKREPAVGFRRPNKIKTLISIYSESTKAIMAQTFGIRQAAGSGPVLTLLSPKSNPETQDTT